jgi:hypothetical protein
VTVRALIGTAVAALVATAAAAPAADAKAPTKLWYRVSVEFDGTLTRTLTSKAQPAPNGNTGESFLPLGPLIDRWRQKWSIASRNAVVVNRDGRGRPRFLTLTRGRIEAATHAESFPSSRRQPSPGNGTTCDPWDRKGTLEAPVRVAGPLGGAALEPQGTVTVGVGWGSRAGTLLYSRPTITCRTDAGATSSSTRPAERRACCVIPVSDPRTAPARFYGDQRVMGTEYYLGDRPIAEERPIRIGAKKFGGPLSTRRSVSYTYTVETSGSTAVYQWSYNWTYTLDPCPRRGRDVENC